MSVGAGRVNSYDSREKYLALLEQTPRRIAVASSNLDEVSLRFSAGSREWSAMQILSHLRACEELWSFSIYAMLVYEHPVLPLLDERIWAKTARYDSLTFRDLLQTFSLKRGELLGVLRPLPLERWLRAADIGGRAHTVFSQVRRMALHEAEHCEQMHTFLGKLR
jgi:hypothetical protein